MMACKMGWNCCCSYGRDGGEVISSLLWHPSRVWWCSWALVAHLSCFHSGDTSTAWIITRLAAPRRYIQFKECSGREWHCPSGLTLVTLEICVMHYATPLYTFINLRSTTGMSPVDFYFHFHIQVQQFWLINTILYLLHFNILGTTSFL